MKNILLTTIFILFANIYANATHLMGGQLTVEHLGADSTLVKLTIYRDTIGVPMDTNYQAFYIYSDPFCINNVSNITFDFNGYTNIGNGVEEYVFTKLLHANSGMTYFPDSAIADYYIKWELCCRNQAISNITNAAGNSMVLQTQYHTFGTTSINSTPVFLNQPVTTAMVNQPWQYNPLPYDADGDSLYWYIDTPWNQCQVNCAGYTMPAFANNDPFTINSSTGQITWTPGALGNWNATVMVNEYRNGQFVGFIRRDMQIIVLDSATIGTGNKPTFAVGGTNVQNQQQFMFSIPANYNFNLVTNATDIDNDDLKITIQGEPFILANNPATYTATDGAGTSTATLSWMPNTAQIRDKMYNLAIRNYEKNANSVYVNIFDITVQLKVTEFPTTISTTNSNTFLTISPIPANQFTTLQFDSKINEKMMLSVVDIAGKVCRNIQLDAKQGINGMIIETNELKNGIYFIQLNGKNVKTSSKLVVHH